MKRIVINSLFIALASWYSASCVYKELPTTFDCQKTSLSLVLESSEAASSCRSIDGSISVSATGGLPPYAFSIGDSTFQTDPVFQRLAPGSYIINVKDARSCMNTLKVELAANNSTLAAVTQSTTDNQCETNNGTITVTVSQGTEPYQMKIDNGTFGTANTFINLANGNHTIIVKDKLGCERVLIVPVPRGNTGISYSSTILPIFMANCAFPGCHGTGTTGRDWTKFSDVKAKAKDIKTRTSNRSMPLGDKTLTTLQIQQIACWVDDGANNN